MNAKRRKTIESAVDRYQDDLMQIREELAEAIEDVVQEEQEAYDNLPGSVQESGRGCYMQAVIDGMEDVLDMIRSQEEEDFISALKEVIWP